MLTAGGSILTPAHVYPFWHVAFALNSHQKTLYYKILKSV